MRHRIIATAALAAAVALSGCSAPAARPALAPVKPVCPGVDVFVAFGEPTSCDVVPGQTLNVVGVPASIDCALMGGEREGDLCLGVDF